MTYIKALIAATFISMVSMPVYAATVDDVPPAHKQKNEVPQTTENGNYLETQPIENNNVRDPKDPQHQNSKSKAKGKNVTDKPQEGGVEVSPR